MGKSWVTGANGQLGMELRDLADVYTDYDFVFTDVEDLDITDHDAVFNFVVEHKISTLINCAAYTAVDRAQTEMEKANAINHLAVANLARIVKQNGLAFIHISTDYVFDGNASEPYQEMDTPNPQSVYGRTKLDGENAIFKVNPARTLIIRTSWVYSSYGSNFVKTMLQLGREKKEINVVDDQIGSPTYARDLATTLMGLLPKLQHTGTEMYHYANVGHCSWYTFAQTIFELSKVKVKVNPVDSSYYPTAAQRPQYSVLATEKIEKSYNIKIADWREALSRCLTQKIPY